MNELFEETFFFLNLKKDSWNNKYLLKLVFPLNNQLKKERRRYNLPPASLIYSDDCSKIRTSYLFKTSLKFNPKVLLQLTVGVSTYFLISAKSTFLSVN